MNRQLTHRIVNELAPGAHLVRNQPHPSERGSAWGGLSPTNKPHYASLGNSRNIVAYECQLSHDMEEYKLLT